MKLSHRALVGALLATTVPTLIAQTAAAEPTARPGFAVLPPHGYVANHNPAASLQTWSGTIKYNNHTYNTTMVGTDPSTSNSTTTVTVYLVPVIMNYTKGSYGSQAMKFNPTKDQWNGTSVMKSIQNSPLFQDLDWNWGGTDVGSEAYNDAFQRASFWEDVSVNTSYHVVLSPTVLPPLKLKPTTGQGGKVVANPFGGSGKAGEMNINSFDSALQKYMSANSASISPTGFVLFVTDNIYLTSGGCCIGGYHSAAGSQTYGTATFAFSSGAKNVIFSQDIAAFSHEIGEWVADPLITSNSPCGLLEVGDPLEGLSNYGTFPVTYNSLTWHPQALAMMEYFGDPANFSMNNWLDNQHDLSSVCQNGQ